MATARRARTPRETKAATEDKPKELKTFPAWLNTATGTIIPITDSNRPFGKKPTVVKITASLDEDSGQAYDVHGGDNYDMVKNAKGLAPKVQLLKQTNQRRDELMVSILSSEGGQALLEKLGLFDEERDGDLYLADDDQLGGDEEPAGEPKNELDKMDLEAMKAASKAKVAKKPVEADPDLEGL